MPEPAAESKAYGRNALTFFSSIIGRTQKPRWIQDFHILFSHSDPNRRYRPGEVVRGEVQIRPTKPTRVTHITVALYGYAQVFKTFNAPGEGPSKEASHADPNRLLSAPGIVKLFTPVERTLQSECKLPNRLLRFQFAIPLPSHRLPTSIEFERGSISYQLVATITRPSTIGPILRCDPRRLHVNEDIDIAVIPAPKPRAVTLEPVESRSKTKRKTRTNKRSNSPPAISDQPGSERSSRSHSRAESRNSFTPSENISLSNYSESIEFRVSGQSNNINHNSTNDSNSNASHAQTTSTGAVSTPETALRFSVPPENKKVIYASSQVMKGGYLPGDKIPIKIMVTHTKQLKSMSGIIITLYRKTHIDTQPVLHKAEIDENGQTNVTLIKPEIYQKSAIGLSGLSLSNSGTSSTYRMDIAQATVPLMIDPHTLKAEINTILEIPHEGVTPTITKVRGQSIDFRYYVEVCLDLQGKLENARLMPRLTAQSLHGFGKSSTSGGAALPMSLAAHGNHLIDTALLRREKPQIIAWQFHVVIGTRDSARMAKHQAISRQQSVDRAGDMEPQPSGNSTAGAFDDRPAEDIIGLGRVLSVDTHNGSTQSQALSGSIGHTSQQNILRHGSIPLTTRLTPPIASIPSVPMPEEPVDEKERQRRYEESLLPSAPPPLRQDTGASSSAAVSAQPSVPPESLFEETHGSLMRQVSDITRRTGSANTATPSQTSDHVVSSMEAAQPSSSSRKGSNTRTSASQHGNSDSSWNDDKQEMERRRLMTQSSSPQYDGEDEYPTTSSALGQTQSQPCAPRLADLQEVEDEELSHWSSEHEALPKYER